MRVRVRRGRYEARAFECTHSWSLALMLLLHNNTLQLQSSLSMFEESTIVPSAFSSEPEGIINRRTHTASPATRKHPT